MGSRRVRWFREGLITRSLELISGAEGEARETDAERGGDSSNRESYTELSYPGTIRTHGHAQTFVSDEFYDIQNPPSVEPKVHSRYRCSLMFAFSFFLDVFLENLVKRAIRK